MQWSDAIKEDVAAAKTAQVNAAALQKMLSVIDLTSLNNTDTESSIASFCQKARTPLGNVAAVCVSPAFVRLVVNEFANSSIAVATVANFPQGDAALTDVLTEIGREIEDGAEEIDVVFPYQRYLAGENQYAHNFVAACKAACGDNVKLKVILETGALDDVTLIADAAYEALAAGADFIKTSTGKITQGATLEAAATMLFVIRHIQPQLKHPVGLKVSGGIREIQQAAQYMALAERIMGHDWLSPQNFRIGASKLVDEILRY